MYNDVFLHKKLNERKAINAFRQLKFATGDIDFFSNDYLGIAHNKLLHQASHLSHGSTGSRLLSGNTVLAEDAETMIANFHEAEAALLFNSGYDANIGLLSCVPQKGDTIVYDQWAHASIRDGIRLSFANAYSYKHNDLDDLESKLKQAKGNIFVVTEAVFSMDGDTCCLPEIVSLCKQYGAHLVIDEAHAIGVIGNRGEGLAQSLNLHHDCFARVYTYGKACGCHGAAVVGSNTLRDYLINFARSFMFTTALPPLAVDAIVQSYKEFSTMVNERLHLQHLIDVFSKPLPGLQKLQSATPIQGLLFSSNEEVKAKAALLQENNFEVRAILHPTVPKGKERLRVILHSFNTAEQVNEFIGIIKQAG